MNNWKQSSALHACRKGSQEAFVAGPGLCIRELPFSGKLLLQARGNFDAISQAVSPVIGRDLPISPNTSSPNILTANSGSTPSSTNHGNTVLWLGPRKCLIILESGNTRATHKQLETALSGIPSLVSEVSDSRTGIEISGVQARSLLAKICALDLDDRSFGPGQSAPSLLIRVPLLLYQADGQPTFHLYVDRSVARYAWDWLSDAAVEFVTNTTQL
jgi:heterotetrameric sarcosine oxidase gamma subunit